MNFYNPYLYALPQGPSILGIERLTNLTKGFSIGSFINGTQKTLNIINQVIPIIKEASPMVKNAKTMFKIANEFKKSDIKNPPKEENITIPEKTINNQGPTFFL